MPILYNLLGLTLNFQYINPDKNTKNKPIKRDTEPLREQHGHHYGN